VGGVTWFHNDIRNLITSGPGAHLPEHQYRPGADARGGNLPDLEGAGRTLTFRADYTYTDSLDATTRLALLRRRATRASLGADWQAMDELQLKRKPCCMWASRSTATGTFDPAPEEIRLCHPGFWRPATS